MPPTARPYHRQAPLLPPDLRDWSAGEGTWQHHVSDLVDGLDRPRRFTHPARRPGDGRRKSPYEPVMPGEER